MAKWLYSKIGDIQCPPPDHPVLRTAAMEPVSQAYRANILRLHAFWVVSPLLIQKSTILLLNTFEATMKVLGHFPATAEDRRNPELKNRVKTVLMQSLAEKTRLAKEGKLSGLEKNVEEALDQFDKLIEDTSGDIALDDAIYAALSSQLTGGWTAFEILAADLWEAALNAHPSTLANLSGSRKRIQKKSGRRLEENDTDDSKKQNDPRLRAFEKITKGTFNAEKVMGTLLRDEFHLDKLRGIREAYSAAFSKRHEKIDELLAHKCLDQLSLIRNLLLHQAGKVDQQFIDAITSIGLESKGGKGDQLLLNGAIVCDLLNPVFAIGWELLIAVDEWISPPKEANDVSDPS